VQGATALLAVGDTVTPLRAMVYLAVSQREDGGFYQNFWIDGRPYWTGLQLDEVSFPIVLAWRLWKENALGSFDPYVTVQRACGFLMREGPATSQDRWEEAGGYSPSTLASNIAGLICAADFIEARGDKLKSLRLAARKDQPPARKIERPHGVSRTGGHLANAVISQSQFPDLPRIGSGSFAREENRLRIERDIGIGRGREVRNQRLGLAVAHRQQLRTFREPFDSMERGERLIRGRGGDKDRDHRNARRLAREAAKKHNQRKGKGRDGGSGDRTHPTASSNSSPAGSDTGSRVARRAM